MLRSRKNVVLLLLMLLLLFSFSNFIFAQFLFSLSIKQGTLYVFTLTFFFFCSTYLWLILISCDNCCAQMFFRRKEAKTIILKEIRWWWWWRKRRRSIEKLGQVSSSFSSLLFIFSLNFRTFRMFLSFIKKIIIIISNEFLCRALVPHWWNGKQ